MHRVPNFITILSIRNSGFLFNKQTFLDTVKHKMGNRIAADVGCYFTHPFQIMQNGKVLILII
jgi:hypothetical protein